MSVESVELIRVGDRSSMSFALAAAWWDTLFVGLTRPLRAWGQMAVQDVGTFPVVRFESGLLVNQFQPWQKGFLGGGSLSAAAESEG